MKKYQRMHLIFIRQYIKQIMEYKVDVLSDKNQVHALIFFHTNLPEW